MSADRDGGKIGSTGAGFTLLEVVVALAIAALALVGLFHAAGGGLFAADTAVRIAEAVERAQSHLAAFTGSGAITPGRSAGDDGGGYRWEAEARPVAQQSVAVPGGGSPPRAPAPGAAAQTLYDVTVTISWPSGRTRRSVVLQTRRLGAAPGTE
jgi:general secretion pathway protein I